MKKLMTLMILGLLASCSADAQKQQMPEEPKNGTERQATEYEKAKGEWIRKNPEAYKKLEEGSKADTPPEVPQQEGLPASFPKHQGNEFEYDHAKGEWVKSHPNEYGGMGGLAPSPNDTNDPPVDIIPEDPSLPATPLPTTPKEDLIKQQGKDALFGKWVLRDGYAEDSKGKRDETESAALREDWTLGKAYILFAPGNKVEIHAPDKGSIDLLLFQLDGDHLGMANIEDGRMGVSFAFTIKELSDNLLVLEQASDDDDGVFSYVLEFSK